MLRLMQCLAMGSAADIPASPSFEHSEDLTLRERDVYQTGTG